MKVNGPQPSGVGPLGPLGGSQSTSRAESAKEKRDAARAKGDGEAAVISEKGAEQGRLVDFVLGLPEGDTERVEAIKTQVKDGSYNVPARDVAVAILRQQGVDAS